MTVLHVREGGREGEEELDPYQAGRTTEREGVIIIRTIADYRVKKI